MPLECFQESLLSGIQLSSIPLAFGAQTFD